MVRHELDGSGEHHLVPRLHPMLPEMWPWRAATHHLDAAGTFKTCFDLVSTISSRVSRLFHRFALLNVVVFMIGFLSNLEGGFQKSWAFPIAKVGCLESHLQCKTLGFRRRWAQDVLASNFCRPSESNDLKVNAQELHLGGDCTAQQRRELVGGHLVQEVGRVGIP